MTFLYNMFEDVYQLVPEEPLVPEADFGKKLKEIADEYNKKTSQLSDTERARAIKLIVVRAKTAAATGKYEIRMALNEIDRDPDRKQYHHWYGPNALLIKEVQEVWHLNIMWTPIMHVSTTMSGYTVQWKGDAQVQKFEC